MSNGSQSYTFLKEDIFLVGVNCFPGRKLIWEIIKNGVFLFVSLYFSGSGKYLMSTRCLCSVVIQSPSHVRLFATPWTAARQAALSLTISRSLPKFMFVVLVMPSVISSSAVHFFCPWPFPASGTFPISHLCASDDQNTGASASVSVPPVNTQCWYSLRLTGLISLLSKGISGVFSSTTVQRHQFFGVLPSLRSGSHSRTWPLGRP